MFKPILVIPCYNHANQFAHGCPMIKSCSVPVIVIDDGSNDAQSKKLQTLCRKYGFEYLKSLKNGGKGAAVINGMQYAWTNGYTHVVQIDADGQHDIWDVAGFVKLAEKNPTALIVGQPVYDETAPKSRMIGRKITKFWVAVETLNLKMPDTMCGFRVYPLKETINILKNIRFKRMGFDIEILIKLYWSGIAIKTKNTRVIYPKNGVSNFRVLHDNFWISVLHAYLCCLMPFKMIKRMIKLCKKKSK